MNKLQELKDKLALLEESRARFVEAGDIESVDLLDKVISEVAEKAIDRAIELNGWVVLTGSAYMELPSSGKYKRHFSDKIAKEFLADED